MWLAHHMFVEWPTSLEPAVLSKYNVWHILTSYFSMIGVHDSITIYIMNRFMKEIGNKCNSAPAKYIKTSIDYFKCLQHTGQRPETHHTPPSHRVSVTIHTSHSPGNVGPYFLLPMVSARPWAGRRLTQTTAHIMAQFIVTGSNKCSSLC